MSGAGSSPATPAKICLERKLMLIKGAALELAVVRKVFINEIILKKDNLKEFFDAIPGYKGPFRKSIWVKHTDLIKMCKSLDIELIKNNRTGKYFIKEEVVLSEPILFDTELLDIPKEN
jgi:hypothetical protein